MNEKDLRKRCDELFAEMEQTCSVIERVKFGEYFELRNRLLKEMEARLEKAETAIQHACHALANGPVDGAGEFNRSGEPAELLERYVKVWTERYEEARERAECAGTWWELVTKIHHLLGIEYHTTTDELVSIVCSRLDRGVEAQAEVAAMWELARQALNHAKHAAEDLPRGTTIRDDYLERQKQLDDEFNATDAGRDSIDRLRKAEAKLCDQCDGSGQYYIDGEPQTCICVGEKKPYQRLEDRAEFAEAALKRAVEATEQTQTPLAEEEELHDWVVRNEDVWRKALAKQAALTEKAERERDEALNNNCPGDDNCGSVCGAETRSEGLQEQLEEARSKIKEAHDQMDEVDVCRADGTHPQLVGRITLLVEGCDQAQARVKELEKAYLEQEADNKRLHDTKCDVCMEARIKELEGQLAEALAEVDRLKCLPTMPGEEASDE